MLGVVDQGELALRRDQFDDLVEVSVRLVQADHIIDGRQAQARDFLRQRQAVVDHVVGAQFLHPVGRFRTRGRADDGHTSQLPRQLHQHGADAAGRADHEKRLARQTLVAAELQAVEQQFPGRNRRERQGGGRSEIEAGRHVADDALVD